VEDVMTELHRVPTFAFKCKYKLTALIETGTGAGGNAVHAGLVWGFEKIASCEINYDWALQAYQTFLNNDRVLIIPKKSIDALPMMVEFVGDRRRLFWLDAHFPTEFVPETPEEMIPLRKELEYIKTLPGIEKDVILIDDARLFDPDPQIRPRHWNFPIVITLDEIRDMFPDHIFSVDRSADHVIFLLPKDSK
jgi:hypothetical protein